MLCDNCGAVAESNAKFCDSCGKTLGLPVSGGNQPAKRRTMASCSLCGKEALLDGYGVTIAGVALDHVCADCRELCSKDPKRIVDEHRDVFEKMLAERRESLAGRSDGPRRSELEHSLVKRYRDAYRVAKTIVIFGDTIKVIGVILTGLIAFGTMIFMIQTGSAPTLSLPLPVVHPSRTGHGS